ncbi:MAG: hypothetical protein QOG99_2568 [Frankiales bacterium]|jgi:hypothetical protein|nr:hypothetical protein [Frankiales bacterium]
MYTRRRAAVAVVALLLALLSPTAGHHSGTPSARVGAVGADAVPAARPASRPHHDAAPLLDATPTSTLPPVAVEDRGTYSPPAPLPAYHVRGAVQARGPPTD